MGEVGEGGEGKREQGKMGRYLEAMRWLEWKVDALGVNRRGGLCKREWGMGKAEFPKAGRKRLVSHWADEEVTE